MNESVIFALRSGDAILCEWREFSGTMQHCIPGGSIESCDRQQKDYVLAAVKREIEEELGVIPQQFERIGDFASNSVKFHVVLVEKWTGTVSRVNHDNQNELHWVSLDELTDGISLNPLKRIIEKVKNT